MSEKRPSVRKAAQRVAVVAAGLGLSAAIAHVLYPGVFDAYKARALGRETAQEHVIGDALARVYGKSILVYCTDQMAPIVDTSGQRARGMAPGVWGVSLPGRPVLLSPKTCDTLAAFAADPANIDDVPAVAVAVEAAAHELSHHLGSGDRKYDSRENVAQCRAVERVGGVAEAFGASPDVAQQLAALSAQNWKTGIPEYDNLPEGCFDGGAYDLDPSKPGTFPEQS